MPLINRINPTYANNTDRRVNHVTEDPRPGHDVLYMGMDFAAHNAKTLKRIWGMNLSVTGDIPERVHVGASVSHANYQQTTTNDHRRDGYLSLAGINPVASATHHTTGTLRNTDKYATQPELEMWQSMDYFHKGTGIFRNDNGNGTSNILRTGQYSVSRTSNASFHTLCRWVNVKDDEELYEIAPHNDEYQNNSYLYNGVMFFKDEVGDKVVSGGVQARGNYFGHYRHRVVYAFLNNGTYISRSQGNNDHHMQLIGKSEVDGKPIYLELYNHPYTPVWTVKKFDYTANTFTNLLTRAYSNAGWSPFDSWNTSYGPSSVSQYHRSGGNDARLDWCSDWFTNSDNTGAYAERFWFTMYPRFDTTGQMTPVSMRWDKSNDTFAPTRGDGAPSGNHWGHYLYDNQGTRRSLWSTNQNNIVNCSPMELNICGDHDSTNIHNSYGLQIHGRARYDGAEKKTFDPRTSMNAGTGSNFMTFMQTTGKHNGFDGQPKAKRLIVWRNTMADANNETSQRVQQSWLTSYTDLPETPRNFAFLDKDRTILAAMCFNATYIYQFRVGGEWWSQTSGNWMAQNGQDAVAYHSTGFNTSLASNQRRAAWVHTATIPYRVAQIGHDKYDRVWYVTDNADPFPIGGYGTTNGTTQLWLLTDDTPMRVDFGGNATTDTITYSGSNIDKTLTIEALNYIGQRLAKTVTLKISGSDAQFDNGTQSKNVTCSSSGTVSETITVTGNGSFDITAQYGA